MDDNKALMTVEDGMPEWQVQVLAVGGVLGLLVGLGAAYVFIRQTVESGAEKPKVGTGELVGLGLMLLGMINQVGSMGAKKKKK